MSNGPRSELKKLICDDGFTALSRSFVEGDRRGLVDDEQRKQTLFLLRQWLHESLGLRCRSGATLGEAVGILHADDVSTALLAEVCGFVARAGSIADLTDESLIKAASLDEETMAAVTAALLPEK